MIEKEALISLAENIERHAFRHGYVSAFTLTAYPTEEHPELTIHITRECERLVYGNAEVGSKEAFRACVEALDGRVDFIVYDVGLFRNVIGIDDIPRGSGKKSVYLPYSDVSVWSASVHLTLLALMPDLPLRKIVVVSKGKVEGSLTARLLTDLAWFCEDIWVCNLEDERLSEAGFKEKIFKGADVVIGSAVYQEVIGREEIILAGGKPLIVDAGIGTISLDASEYARKNGIRMIRVDNRAAMAGTLLSIIQSYDLVTRVMGAGEIGGVKVVAGGIVGEPGTIIVDSIHNPVQVIGIADGTGKVRYEPKDEEERLRLEQVKRLVEGL